MRTHRSSRLVREFENEEQFCVSHGLELERASDYGWIVRRTTPNHFGHIVGCIDQLDDAVELMKLDGGFCWARFDTLHDALENLVVGLSSESTLAGFKAAAVKEADSRAANSTATQFADAGATR